MGLPVAEALRVTRMEVQAGRDRVGRIRAPRRPRRIRGIRNMVILLVKGWDQDFIRP